MSRQAVFRCQGQVLDVGLVAGVVLEGRRGLRGSVSARGGVDQRNFGCFRPGVVEAGPGGVAVRVPPCDRGGGRESTTCRSDDVMGLVVYSATVSVSVR